MKLEERIIIHPGKPDEIVITMTDLDGDKVRLGFSAAPEVVIHREKVWLRIEQDRKVAEGAKGVRP